MNGALKMILLLPVIAGLLGCSGQKKVVMIPEPLPEQKDHRQLLLRKKVTSLLGKGSFRRAIELVRGNSPGSPAPGLEQEYLAGVNGLIATGEERFAHGDYGTAGDSFKGAIDSYPADPVLRERVRGEPKQLKIRLESCSSVLMEEGLQEYRRGNLENAIRKWKRILVFTTGHQEAKKAIATATVQLRALNNLVKKQQ